MQTASHSIKKREKPNDVFYTPIPLVKLHLDYIKEYTKPGDLIFDPFFGTGNYYNMFAETFPDSTYDFTEIAMGKDFFEYHKPVDIIVSNPPYSMLDEVFEKSVSLNPYIISYLIGLQNLTARRIENMNKKGYYLVKLKMLKVWKWFGMSAIVVFKRGQDGDTNCFDFDRVVYR